MLDRTRLLLALIALVLVAGIMGVGVWGGLRTRVYWSRVSLVLVAPPATFRPNPLESAPPDLPVTASLVVLRVNGGPQAATSSTMAATLYGEGVKIGHRVSLRNLGSQWQASLGEPIIDVEVVGPTQQWVYAEVERLVTAASDVLASLQDEVGAGPSQRVHLSMVPAVPSVTEVGSSRARLLGSMVIMYAICGVLATRFVRVGSGTEPSSK